ncbi:MAG: SCO family protein [Bacillota bacterium]|nr:SCO family protein [Bacillota bacterium]
MKKIYVISSALILLGILAGISFFLIRDANAKIPPTITLTTQNNDSYRFGDNHKKLKLVEFVYTHCPDICPTTTQKMVALKNKLQKTGVYGKDIQFLTISIDPYRDTPEVMKKYMNSFGISNDGNWVFLTGSHASIKSDLKKIKEAASSLQFQYKDPGNGFFIHSTFTYLLDENNKFIKKFPMGEQFNEQEVYDYISKQL